MSDIRVYSGPLVGQILECDARFIFKKILIIFEKVNTKIITLKNM